MSDETKAMLSIYDEPISEQQSPSSTTEESPDEIASHLSLDASVVPYIGQQFVTHDAAYEFYSQFAKRCGFSIRRHRTEGKDGVGKGLTRRYFVCHRAGNTPSKQPSLKPQRNRKSTRCGCQSYMRISKISDGGMHEWRVTGFVNYHNHELLEPDQVRFLPAYRVISDSDKTRILMFYKSGITVQQMMRLMELEKCVEPGKLPFTEKDVRNFIQSLRKLDQEEEGIDLLRMCKSIKERDPNFCYNFTVDSSNKLENIAWSYASSVQSYDIFGDAVVFDTSHRIAALDMPLGIWIGMNNYGLPCFFGCVLLREENSQSFAWALQVFLSFMNGKAPQTILTDQNVCLKDAIEMEMPDSKHAICLWLIVGKFASWFNAVLGERYTEWKMEFYRLYNCETIEEFEIGWHEMVENYGFQTNRHITNLYACRSLWALPYLRGHFFAGFCTAGASKSINAFIQRFLSAQTQLAHFVDQVAVTVDYRDQTSELQSMQQNLQNISFKTGAPMEAHAASILTPYAFSKLQDELVMATHYACFQTDNNSFLMRHHSKTHTGGDRTVTWVPHHELLSCSCRMFEFSGILCRHALRVLSTANCFQIPDHYMPVRWRRTHYSVVLGRENGILDDQSEKVKTLQLMVSDLLNEAVKSKERVELVSMEVEGLLARLRQQPVNKNRQMDFIN
ncbi:hypothetical protein LUZ61_000464 [Rhynchospora tenuis]|uniref:Protein FAR1-RELATED SEQUENCE n=1 Tax=Rhynchospora tenuis TaxID=198213 RepID=A0AAD6EPU8_9POAL|nr:hypothetical protein LUZ61_000464 [Rhynchospora tenuis]